MNTIFITSLSNSNARPTLNNGVLSTPLAHSSIREPFLNHFLRLPSEASPLLEQFPPYRQAGISCLLANCLRHIKSSYGGRGFFVSLAANNYSLTNRPFGTRNRWLGYRMLKGAYDVLLEAGLIRVVRPGFHYSNNSSATLIAPTDKCRELLADVAGFAWEGRVQGEVVVNAEEPRPLSGHPEYIASSLEIINQNIAQHEFSLMGLNERQLCALPHHLVRERDGRFIFHPSALLYDRKFNNQELTLGGRFFNEISNLERGMRINLRINGEATAECDYRSLHCRILYAMEGLQAPDDVYAVPGWGTEYRALIKAMALTLPNMAPENNLVSTVASAYREAVAKNARAAHLLGGRPEPGLSDAEVKRLIPELYEDFCKAHAPIVKYFRKGMATHLMYLESEMANYIGLAFSDKGQPVHILHDGFYCMADAAPLLLEKMKEAFEEVTGVKLQREAIKVVLPEGNYA